MTAKQKIEELINSWYGYAVFGAVLSLCSHGVGFFSFLGTVASFFFTIFVTWFLGRRLLAKSSLTRVLLVGLTGLFSLIGTYSAAKMGWTFLQTWSVSVAVNAGVAAVGVYMNARAFKVLTDSSVKAYFT